MYWFRFARAWNSAGISNAQEPSVFPSACWYLHMLLLKKLMILNWHQTLLWQRDIIHGIRYQPTTTQSCLLITPCRKCLVSEKTSKALALPLQWLRRGLSAVGSFWRTSYSLSCSSVYTTLTYISTTTRWFRNFILMTVFTIIFSVNK